MKSNKLKTSVIAIVLITLMAIPMINIPTANAQGNNYKSYPFIGAIPNPVGVGQTVLLHVGMLTALNYMDDGWLGLQVEVVDPDNKTTLINCPKTDSTGGTGVTFVPDKIGTYTLTTIFPKQNSTSYGAFTNNVYLAARSDPLQLVVQENPIEYYPGFPLPTEYWTRPVDAQIREWWTIMGHWLRAPEGFYAPYNDGPATAHVLWQRQLGEEMGGLAGGDFGPYSERYLPTGMDSFENGDAYEGRWPNQWIIAGVLYYQPYESSNPTRPIIAIDLHTGKELWTKDFMGNQVPNFVQLIDWKCMNNDGVFEYLVFSTSAGSGNTVWSGYDAYSGNWRWNFTNVPGGTNYYGQLGEALKYTWSNVGNSTNRQWRLQQWNQSWIVTAGKTGMSESWGSQMRGNTYNCTTRPNQGYDVNVTTDEFRGSSNPSILKVFPNDRIIGGSVSTTLVHLYGINLNRTKGAIGSTLFNTTWTPPAEWAAGNLTVSGFSGGWAAWGQQDKVAVLFAKESRVHYGFSLETGNYLWTAEPEQYLNAWDDSLNVARMIGDGKFISTSISGIVNCYDVQTGKQLWNYSAADPYQEELFSNNWWLRGMFMTDDYAYFGHLEHSANNPRPRGGPFLCLNTTSGEVVWRINGMFRQSRWGGRAIMGDSVIATQDTYNQNVYAIGKGPSALTLNAPNIGVPLGSSVMLSGTVMDVSPGTEDIQLEMRFPNGVPAMSDASQSDWMLYVYKQFNKPVNATGVDVRLIVLDANNNYRDLGTVKTDITGTYNLMWTPEIPGKYTIYAAFAGSGAYYGSSAQTAIGVDAPVVTEAPIVTPQPVSIADQYFIPAISGLFVAIIIVIALVLVSLRKRP